MFPKFDLKIAYKGGVCLLPKHLLHYYVDFENVHYAGLEGIERLDKKSIVYIYCREGSRKYIESLDIVKQSGAEIVYQIVKAKTKNALDFILITDLARNAIKGKLYLVVTNDKGYEASIDRENEIGLCVLRVQRVAWLYRTDY